MIFLYLLFYIVLQAVLPEGFFLLNVRPDLLLVLVVFIGLFNIKRGVLIAIAFGAVKDIFSLGPFGLNIFCFSLWASIFRQLSRQIYKDNKIIYLALVVVATWGNYLVYFLANSFFAKSSLASTGFLFATVFIETIYNFLSAYMLFGIFKKCALNYSLR
ncbi:MAG: rod shape-determining protein MreD [Candidatus Omnitrophota bacterium]|nr:rod shape-determining protein MreD [Candidatus Omnitrophota bacterium]